MDIEDATIPTDELEEIRINYDRGEYVKLAESVRTFLAEHGERVLEFKEHIEGKFKKQFSLEHAIRLLILDIKTVNTKLDLEDQRKVIGLEAYIRHEHGSTESDEEIAIDWIKKYAGAWRIHRIREIVYVFERSKEEYLDLIDGFDL